MATTEFNPFDEGPDSAQAEAEKAALEAGEKIVAAQEEDRLRNFEQREAEAEPLAGKFKTPEELEKAYLELQKKLGEKTPEAEEEPAEEQPEASEEAPVEEEEVEISDVGKALRDYSKEYEENGSLSDETVEALSNMDSKELVKEYLKFYQENAAQQQQQQVKAADEAAILQSVGGAEAYQELVGWAANNLAQEEISDFNGVVNSGNTAAIKFAVEALRNRRVAVEGNEAPLVTGRKSAGSSKDRFRSNAELARAIADPRYQSDPAYRMDVEAKLARSGDLL